MILRGEKTQNQKMGLDDDVSELFNFEDDGTSRCASG